jgi:hypothetical protein
MRSAVRAKSNGGQYYGVAVLTAQHGSPRDKESHLEPEYRAFRDPRQNNAPSLGLLIVFRVLLGLARARTRSRAKFPDMGDREIICLPKFRLFNLAEFEQFTFFAETISPTFALLLCLAESDNTGSQKV